MELTFNGKTYVSVGRMDAFAQLHLARKLAPAIPIVSGLVDPANAEKNKTLLTVLMLAHISEADTDAIIQKCLANVYRKQEGGIQAKVQSQSGVLMFDDMSMQELLEITIAVIEENLGDFFRTALSANLAEPKNPLD